MDEQDSTNDAAWLPAARAYWDAAAPGFDAEPDHGLHDPAVGAAWAELLRAYLPPPPASVLDLGCGTGSLSVLLAALGHAVTGLDFSPAMIALAEAKAEAEAQARTAGVAPAAGPWHRPQFYVMNAAEPSFDPASFDVLLCRHLLWALPAPAEVLRRWAALLKPGGRLLLIEGRWHTGSGLPAAEITAMLPPALALAGRQDLSVNPIYWGKPVDDERYLLATAKR
jgi:SAM-dependent methyltransferase